MCSRHFKARLLPGLQLLMSVGLLTTAIASTAAHSQTAQEVLIGTDKVRNPGQPFKVLNRLTEYRGGQPRQSLTVVVYSKLAADSGQYRNLARYLEPPRDLGKMFLMSGKFMWFFDPASAASVRISPQQRLLGQASNSDVLTVNLNRDYSAAMVGEESIRDADNQARNTWHLDLSAASDAAVYLRIEYWVEKATFYPVKAKFYADSGRPLKVAYYRRLMKQLGGMRPTEAIILDEVDTNVITKMSFSDYRAMEIPERWYQREYLPHLRAQ